MNGDSKHVRDCVNTYVIASAPTITNVKTVRDRLKHARLMRGLSQAELAAAAKCSQSAIGNFESGERKTLRNLVEVARALNVSIEWLYDGRGPGPTVPADGESTSKVIAMESARAYESSQWPFGLSLARVLALPTARRDMIESYMLGMVEAHESSVKKTAGE